MITSNAHDLLFVIGGTNTYIVQSTKYLEAVLDQHLVELMALLKAMISKIRNEIPTVEIAYILIIKE